MMLFPGDPMPETVESKWVGNVLCVPINRPQTYNMGYNVYAYDIDVIVDLGEKSEEKGKEKIVVQFKDTTDVCEFRPAIQYGKGVKYLTIGTLQPY